ncbi:MAG: hypothetical protein ABI622_11315, partial [Chloroflexota bacterium]
MDGGTAKGVRHIAGNAWSGRSDRAQRWWQPIAIWHGDHIADPKNPCSGRHPGVNPQHPALVEKGPRQPIGVAPQWRDDRNQLGRNRAPLKFDDAFADPLDRALGDQLRTAPFEERSNP